MIFKSTINRVTLIGQVSGEIKESPVSEFAVEFNLCVPRTTKPGGRQFFDMISIYVSDKHTIEFIREHCKPKTTIKVVGELRKFKGDFFKVCTSKISLEN